MVAKPKKVATCPLPENRAYNTDDYVVTCSKIFVPFGSPNRSNCSSWTTLMNRNRGELNSSTIWRENVYGNRLLAQLRIQ